MLVYYAQRNGHRTGERSGVDWSGFPGSTDKLLNGREFGVPGPILSLPGQFQRRILSECGLDSIDRRSPTIIIPPHYLAKLVILLVLTVFALLSLHLFGEDSAKI